MSLSKVVGPVFFLAAVSFGCFVVFKTNIQPRLEYRPQSPLHLFERDAVSGELPSIPTFFSTANLARYEQGEGFSVVFRVLNDPRDGYQTTNEKCGVEAWQGPYGEMDRPSRRALIAKRQGEFKECLAYFRATLPVLRTIEVGVDDTEGVNDRLRSFVRQSLKQSLGDPERIFRSGEATALATRLVFFRISDTAKFRYRSWEIRPETDVASAVKAYEAGLDWLLAEAGRKDRTELAATLFKALKKNQDVAFRRILIFSDGMEYSPFGFFYQVLKKPRFLDRSNYDVLDVGIKNIEKVPDLRRAQVTWFVPPHSRRYALDAAKYWEHVLEDLAKSPQAEVIPGPK